MTTTTTTTTTTRTRERWIVARCEVPPLWLVDTCGGGTWSPDEDRAVEFLTERDAVEAVLAADLFAGADRGVTWDAIHVLISRS
jgi:hypothetical protein